MKKFTAWVLLLTVYMSWLAPAATTVRAQVIGKTRDLSMRDKPSGLTFKLSEGSGGAETRNVQAPAIPEPLPDPEAGKLVGRLPAIKTMPDDAADFAKRVGTLPAPKTGEKIPVKFPSSDDMAPPSRGSTKSLEVVRFAPQGEISLAPDLSITFSQPMVAVGSQTTAAEYVPVEFSPSVEGRWRWLGTKTLMFDTDKRFPMATEFTARVPKGTKSATGETLGRDHTWTFTTPPPKAVQMYPNGGQTTARDVLMYVIFDQAVDPAAVIKKISVTAGGRKIQIRLATEEEHGGMFHSLEQQGTPHRGIAFRAVDANGDTRNALPAASSITVTIEKGTPSAEGTLTTTKPQSFNFRTYGAMKMVKTQCGWRNDQNCSPFEQWTLQFSNSIDSSKFTKEMIKIEPAVEGLNIYPSGNYVYIQGYKKGRTSYKLTVDSALKDIFGQTLSEPATATIKVGSAEQSFYSQGGPMTVLDPAAKPSFSIYTTNHTAARVRIYKVQPIDWHAYGQYYRRINYDDGQKPSLPGELVSEKVVPIKSVADELVETRIDISPGLSGGVGNIIVDIEPTIKRDKNDRSRILTWLQATQIGLDAFVDNQELVGFATDLKTGAALSGVALSIYPNDGLPVGSVAESREAEGTTVLGSIWNWIWSWGSSEPERSISVDSDGGEAPIEEIAPSQTNRTGPSGVVRFALSEPVSNKGMNILIARRGNDVAFLPENSDYYWQDSGSWHRKPYHDSLRWFVFDDRKMYKPNEEVAVKGYIRTMTGGKLGDIEPLAKALTYEWSAKDPRNNEIAKGSVTTNGFGAFDLKFKLPDNVNLGHARIDFSDSPNSSVSYTHQYQIQEFRRPEFEVTAKVDTEAPHFVGGHAELSVDAKYYAGGGLANAQANWTVSATPTNYTPPNRDDFTFGTWIPWWRSYDHYGRGGFSGPSSTQYFQGVTDGEGRHTLRIDFESVKPPRPYTISASASVQDVNRQTWAGQTSLLVHPSDLYVGIRTPRTFVQKGENIHIESIVSDLDGNLKAGRDIEIKALLKDWQFDKGAWKEVTVDEQFCAVKSASEPVKCTFTAKAGGRYTISATVMDDRERFNESQITVWVPGGKTPPNREVEQEEVQLIPSKKEYQPGEVAEILVIAPFSPAEGILTLRREGIVSTEKFSIKDSSTTLKFRIDPKFLPNVHAQVDLVGAATRVDDKGEVDQKLSKRPAFASGSLNLAVSTESRKLTVTAEAGDTTLAPGSETKVAIRVVDHQGEPVSNTEVAIVMVDESVLALTRYVISDPAATFYTARQPGVADYHSRKDVLLGNPEDATPTPPPPPPTSVVSEQRMELPQAARSMKSLTVDGASGAENTFVLDGQEVDDNGTPIEMRSNFDALAKWSPSVRTDANGRATVDIKLPDNLTRYRITAVAADSGKRFGKTESNLTAKKPLMVRPSAPRFMNFGDKVELPVVIQNQTDKDMAVNVAMRASNAAVGGVFSEPQSDEIQTAGKRVVVKANGREEIRFPVSTLKAGTARFQFAATSGEYNDAAEISLPVWTPATTEAFATYGTTDQNGAIFQPVQTPGDVFPQFGGLEVTTSSTQLQELTDAFIYLSKYPYMCSEQISSRMISTAALRDVLHAFKAKEIPTPEALEAQFKRDIQILQSRQREDGSFGLWKRDRERYEYPFLTVHVAHALALAKQKGYAVPEEMLNKAKPYLSNIESHYKGDWYTSSPQVRWAISAYALYVRDLMGDKDAGKAKKLLTETRSDSKVSDIDAKTMYGTKMSFEALGWVLSVLADDKNSQAEVEMITRFLMNRTTETAAAANFVTDYGDGGWLIMHSNRRVDGVLLEALLKARKHLFINNPGVQAVINMSPPELPAVPSFEDLIPKLVRGLLAHRTKGHWGSTQENVFILLALDKYFNAYEKVTPDFVTRVWLGGTYAGEQIFKGRSVDSNQLNIPMSYLVDQGGTSNLILDRQGAGRLYYRIGMKYAPKNLKLEPADYGFTVLRTYEAIDDPADVKQNGDGSWTVRSGARVRVRLTMVAQARRYHVALVDQLPAGFEVLNPDLATTEAIPPDRGTGNSGVIEMGSRSFGRYDYWWRTNWFEHQNFRDERAEAFSSLLWEGVYHYTYVTRATTPGRFVVPPAKAEEMYHPETFGRTGTDTVSVE